MERSGADRDINKMPMSSASSMTFLVAIQVISRALTFAANQVLLRHLSPEILGISTQLELYSVSTLYFSRESLRMAIQRQPLSLSGAAKEESDEHHAKRMVPDDGKVDSIASQSVVNVSYISLGLGIPLVMIFAACYLHVAQEEVSESPFFRTSLAIVGIASVLELATEPFFAVVQQRMLYKMRAAVETTAACTKSLLTCGISIWATWASLDIGVLPFALGYLAYSIALFCGYLATMPQVSREKHFSFFLTPIKPSDGTKYLANRFSYCLITFGANVYFQSVVKHVLTQGDSMMLAAMSSLEDQGIYSLASNYGGLIARVFFQPIEESSRNIFSRLIASSEIGNHGISGVSAAKAHLVDLLRAYGILSVLVFSLGPVYLPLILRFLVGSRWKSRSVDGLLSVYCYYIPFLAFNGITEAFVSSAASPSELRMQTVWMGACSACFTAVAYLFLRIGGWGAHGLVWANIVNMAVRIGWCYVFIKSYLRRYKNDLTFSEISLRPYTYATGALTMSIMFTTRQHTATGLYEILKMLSFGIACALLILYLEKEYLIKKCTNFLQKGNLQKTR